MAWRHPVLGLALLLAALAGCVAGPGSGSDGGQGSADIQRIGGWSNPDVPVVGVDAADLAGDGHTDLVLAQENGSITVLDLANRSTVWQDDVGSDVDAVAAVGGERGPAVAVADAVGFGASGPFIFSTRQGTEVRLFNVTSGEEIADRFVEDLHVDRMVADDLDGDGYVDLILAGRPVDERVPLPYGSRTEVAVLDGRFESGGYWSEPGRDDPAVRWRRTVDGDLVELGPVVDGNVPVATDEAVAAFDPVGHRLWTMDLPDVVDLDADAGGVLAVAHEGAVRAAWDRTERWSANLTGGVAGLLDGPGGRTVIAERGDDRETTDRTRLVAYAADGTPTHRTEVDGTALVAGLARVDLVGPGTTVAVGLVHANGTGIVFLDADLARVAAADPAAGGHPEDRLVGADVVPTGRDEAILVGAHARLHVFGQR